MIEETLQDERLPRGQYGSLPGGPGILFQALAGKHSARRRARARPCRASITTGPMARAFEAGLRVTDRRLAARSPSVRA